MVTVFGHREGRLDRPGGRAPGQAGADAAAASCQCFVETRKTPDPGLLFAQVTPLATRNLATNAIS
jgi:hypothetical protein